MVESEAFRLFSVDTGAHCADFLPVELLSPLLIPLLAEAVANWDCTIHGVEGSKMEKPTGGAGKYRKFNYVNQDLNYVLYAVNSTQGASVQGARTLALLPDREPAR